MRLSLLGTQAVLDAARQAAPRELCGALFEDAGGEQWFVVLANLEAGPGRFLVDPAGLAAALLDAERGDKRLVAFWHTHPSGCALPSGADLAGAWKEVPVLVCAPLGVPTWRAWRFSQGVFSEVPLYFEDVPTPRAPRAYECAPLNAPRPC